VRWWRKWIELEWVDKFGYGVMVGFLGTASFLGACSVMNDDTDPIPLTPTVTVGITTTMPSPPTTFCGPKGVPYNVCAAHRAALTEDVPVGASTGP